ncbi:hypothetical protein [Edaphobacter aggregans]|uniref:hypothetical protein n=1 Tax=Edaphobacter aggregans TaxID=570835 RepID=UPI00068E4EA9|nr:hypothetical protein [Edaphobacter aggregans]
MTNALRPSELFAFRWKCFDHEAATLKIIETVYKGRIRPWGKTKSLTIIHIPRSLADDLQEWREECPDSPPDAFIFANQAGGFLDTDNYRKRVLHKLARDLKTAEVDVSGDSENDRYACPEEGHSEGCSGCSPALLNPTTTDVYMRRFPRACRQRSRAKKVAVYSDTKLERRELASY